MNWGDAVPNFLIGLREGLEAGLIVSILLAAVKKSGGSRVPVWLGALGAASLSVSFGAVLTFTTSEMSATAREVVAGTLSVVAVILVTIMIFWMRRTAATLSKGLRGDVEAAMALGAGALVLTAFFAVAREGLETTLFLWTAARASGDAVGPAVGATLGLLVAFGLCVLLYRQAVRLDLGKFFGYTAVLLIVVAAGVLSYGLGDLQNAGVLPGRTWIAFDLTGTVNPDAWWVALLSGITNLAPKMTVLQVFAWLAYLVVVLWAFLRTTPAPPDAHRKSRFETWAESLAGRQVWPVAAVIVVVPLLVAGLIIAVLPSKPAVAESVTVTAEDCAREFSGAGPGLQRISVTNKSGKSGEINLVDGGGAVVGEIETIGPATTADLSATLGNGTYQFVCYLAGQQPTRSAQFTVTGGTGEAPRAVDRVTKADLEGVNAKYQDYVLEVLPAVEAALGRVRSALAAGDVDGAKRAWLDTMTAWERVGASYNSFGAAGTAVAGLPDGFAGGVRDPEFSGIRRIEYGLYRGETPAGVIAQVDKTSEGLQKIRADLRTDDIAGDPVTLTKRAQEILEDALRDHLTGVSDQGAHAGYAATAANVDATRAVLRIVEPLLVTRAPDLVPTARRELDEVTRALDAVKRPDGTYPPIDAPPLALRQKINGTVGQALETLSAVPNLLEMPKHER
ncbi:Iron permease FTR1 OS=Tsukamurella paurometabola (strain ATCC 8368 / DSM / CCUG 35730 / CIP 100753 / JCM 10117 / KCTC 9821 / NBRC 16120 / NCIMB 702349 /NCTC 13040) OX=521096 GN=Tpau_3348 PE=3 SV=1 [Tsukamurella paurometabola]|uniref:Iron permease FTR1 n=1 Tax=Tsukamurella paurometabola (strain ATCC 8368 / DSM 20162 / CCUG 35730 / CIP 100753 / JCM 10117 / KCTC 9821 / NBRC 16120 / NCIMB 702349 / NCTC 13040) TaxID=521096 RepID=D5UWD3_TSUPD|nr:iron uptake transporter permease EfeU [Tsukamurella paurometabola]ADG79932.1 iron permease FTR1 [Tsukamurella paurometabola DSM 20162]SUP37709.1 Ferrous iron uptake protein [Tsukamurella paurometabola]